MPLFKLLVTTVEAERVGPDGVVHIDGRELVGDPGAWVVVDHQGGWSTWSDAEFREAFEPANDAARRYLYGS